MGKIRKIKLGHIINSRNELIDGSIVGHIPLIQFGNQMLEDLLKVERLTKKIKLLSIYQIFRYIKWESFLSRRIPFEKLMKQYSVPDVNEQYKRTVEYCIRKMDHSILNYLGKVNIDGIVSQRLIGGFAVVFVPDLGKFLVRNHVVSFHGIPTTLTLNKTEKTYFEKIIREINAATKS